MSREPLVIRGAIVSAAAALLHVLVITGALGITPDAERAIAVAVDMIGTAILVIWTRGSVTPVDDPRDDNGDPLVPVDEDVDYTSKHRGGAA